MTSEYPFPVYVYQWRYERYRAMRGDDDPMVRALFGRFVGRRGGVLSLGGSGRAAFVANRRILGNSGYDNRRQRRHAASPRL